MSTYSSFVQAFQELLDLSRQSSAPRDAIHRFLEICDHLDKCVMVKGQSIAASRAGEDHDILEQSDLFKRYMAAFRARNWPLVTVIQHEICSSKVAYAPA